MSERVIFEQMPLEECHELLQHHHLGRIALVDDGQPVVFPVNYVLDGKSIVIRTNDGTKLVAAAQRLVAFEIDSFSDETRHGWSVLVKGICYDITNTRDHRSEALRNIWVDSWLPTPPIKWLEVVPTEVTGRRISAAQ